LFFGKEKGVKLQADVNLLAFLKKSRKHQMEKMK